MLTPSYFFIRKATIDLLEGHGFSKQEALHLIDAETEYLTYKDKKLVNKLSLKKKKPEKDKIISTYQKQKLIEYLLGLKSGKRASSTDILTDKPSMEVITQSLLVTRGC